MRRNGYTYLYHALRLFAALLPCALSWWLTGVPLLRAFAWSFSTVAKLVLPMVLSVISLKRLVILFRIGGLARKANRHVSELAAHHISVVEGPPGVGKTLTMTADGVSLAAAQEQKLYCDYAFYAAQISAKAELTSEEYAIYRDLEAAIAYIEAHPDRIPLLFANYRIRVGDRVSNDLTPEHFLQHAWLPQYAVLLESEAADDFDNQRFLHKEQADDKARVNKFFSKIRHYIGGYSLNDEQDKRELHIGLRRVVGLNRYLVRREELYRPAFLSWLLRRLERRVLRRGYATVREGLRRERLERLIGRIGFFEIFYIDYGMIEKSAAAINEGSFVLALNFPFEYESRGYRFEYAPDNLRAAFDPKPAPNGGSLYRIPPFPDRKDRVKAKLDSLLNHDKK